MEQLLGDAYVCIPRQFFFFGGGMSPCNRHPWCICIVSRGVPRIFHWAQRKAKSGGGVPGEGAATHFPPAMGPGGVL